MERATEKARQGIGRILNRGKWVVCGIIHEKPHLLRELLLDATEEDLVRMPIIFRHTDLWSEFLRVLLSLPQNVWMAHELHAKTVFQDFENGEIEEIICIYRAMSTSVRVDHILFYLDYDQYWENAVKNKASQGHQSALAELAKARTGFILEPPLPTQASDKCLASLTAYVDSLEKNVEKKIKEA